jgi:hypothetical protein
MDNEFRAVAEAYSRIAAKHALRDVRRETWRIKVASGITPDEAFCRLQDFAPAAGWAVRLGAEPSLAAIGAAEQWWPPPGGWIAAAEAVSTDGRSLSIRPGQSGLDLVEISAAAGTGGTGQEVLVVETGFVTAHHSWGGRLRYAVAWAEGFVGSGAGHCIPIATRFLGYER